MLQITKSSYSSLSTTWSAQTILYLWKYTRSIWMHRNQVVHGKTDQDIANKTMESIHDQVRNSYTTFRTNSNFILSHHHYLFTSWSLTHHLNLDIDSLHRANSSSSDSTYSLSSPASVTTTYDTASLETTLDSWENTTVSMTTLSNSSLNSSTTTSSLGTFITTYWFK